MPSAILAQATPAAPAQGGPPDLLVMLPFMLFAFVVFIFLPMRRERKQRQEMMTAIDKGARVIVGGTIVGTVQQTVAAADSPSGEDELLVKVDENNNLRLRVLRTSVTRVIRDKPAGKDTKDGSA